MTPELDQIIDELTNRVYVIVARLDMPNEPCSELQVLTPPLSVMEIRDQLTAWQNGAYGDNITDDVRNRTADMHIARWNTPTVPIPFSLLACELANNG